MNYISWLNTELIKLSKVKCEYNRNKQFTLNKILNNNKINICLEFGVYNGNTINIISKKCSSVFGFDSFKGLPEDWDGVCKKEHFIVHNLPKIDSNVILIKGWFKDSLDLFLSKNDINIDMIHIDCDLYSSTKDIFNILIKYNKIKPGLIIVFDELINYNKFYEGEIKALYELCTEYNIKFTWLGTHGKVATYNQVLTKEFQSMSFKQYRNKGFQQEVAIIISK